MDFKKSILFFTTVPDLETARAIADTLLKEKLVACVSILPGSESHYFWEGKKEVSQEILLTIKTTADRYEKLEARLSTLHPYECPEMVSFAVDKGFPPYLKWITDSVSCENP